MDWVPCAQYGDFSINIGGGGQLDLALLFTDWMVAANDVEGRVEDTPYFKCVRIVGYWDVFAADVAPAQGFVSCRCWPGFVENTTGDPIVPGFVTDASASNEKFWWDRIVPASDMSAEPWARVGSYAHPYSYIMDIKPNMWMDTSQVPVFSVENSSDDDVRFVHRFRMLTVSP